MRTMNRITALAVTALLFAGCNQPGAGGHLNGRVVGAGQPVANATVTLYSATAGAPAQLGQATSGADGRFQIAYAPATNAVLYVIAAGGRPAGAKADAASLELVTLLLGSAVPDTVTVNELTTVASAFTAARFINNGAISGNPLGLKIAAGNVPNLVDPATGTWGKVLLDPINSDMTTALANLNTMSSLLTASYTVGDDAWRAKFFKAATPTGGATPKNTFEAAAGIAREPWAAPGELFALFDAAYPQPKDGSRRAAPFLPYLAYAPKDLILSLAFGGGGVYANGRFMFDAEGNLWSGQNWMPGSQSGVLRNIGGGVAKFSPNGVALSPPITGFTGMGLDGVGWGTAVTNDRVWASSFNGKILVMDFDGKPVATEADFPVKGVSGLMGIGVATNGDVWIADGSNDQLLYFPGGRIKDEKIVKPAGLKSPFDIVIDTLNRVWVSNSSGTTVVRFPADDPSKVETFPAGISVRALALDSKGNVWVASNMDLSTPMLPIPDGASIMLQFKIVTESMMKRIFSGHTTGQVNLIHADGTQLAPRGITDPAINTPWGINVDGNDDVWFGNMWARSVVLMAGDGTKGHPAGTKTGDIIHVFQSGSIQMLTDVSIDAAGNVWAANNWNSLEGASSKDPAGNISTWGGGSNLTVIYGVAAPVKPPRMGPVRTY